MAHEDMDDEINDLVLQLENTCNTAQRIRNRICHSKKNELNGK
jgi:hypothetical protein